MSEFPNWFSAYAERFFRAFLSPLAGKPGLRFLQVGAFTGDASLWLFDNILTHPTSTLTDVDTWAGSDEPEHEPIDFAAAEKFYDQRTAHLDRLTKFKGTSEAFWRGAGGRFDFIYIDGAHTAYDVLNDAVHAYPLLNPGGLIAFDDYLWKSGKGRLHDPGPAVDAFADLYGPRLEPRVMELQAWFRRAA